MDRGEGPVVVGAESVPGVGPLGVGGGLFDGLDVLPGVHQPEGGVAGGADRTVTPGPPFSPRASTRRMVRASRVGSIGWPGPKS